MGEERAFHLLDLDEDIGVEVYGRRVLWRNPAFVAVMAGGARGKQ